MDTAPHQEKSLVIRQARLDELGKTAEVIRAAYAEYTVGMPEDRASRYLDRSADVESRLDASELLIAELDGRLVGSVTICPDAALSAGEGWPDGWLGIRLLAVVPEARGCGIGRALVQACIHRAHEVSAPVVVLHTTEMMAVARGMYERMGFVRAHGFDLRFGSGPEILAYRLDLALLS